MHGWDPQSLGPLCLHRLLCFPLRSPTLCLALLFLRPCHHLSLKSLVDPLQQPQDVLSMTIQSPPFAWDCQFRISLTQDQEEFAAKAVMTVSGMRPSKLQGAFAYRLYSVCAHQRMVASRATLRRGPRHMAGFCREHLPETFGKSLTVSSEAWERASLSPS